MNELLFCDAIRPAPVSILNLLMRHYSVGHEIILLSRRNPLLFLSEEEFAKLPGEDQRSAIVFAADACSQSWAEYHEQYSNAEKMAVEQKWKDWHKLIEDADYPAAIAAWRKYREGGSASFRLEEMPSNGGEFRYFGQPELAGLLNFLQIKCRMSLIEAFDSPLSVARMRHQAWLECAGSLRIQNHIEAEIARRRDEYFKAHPEPEFELQAEPAPTGGVSK